MSMIRSSTPLVANTVHSHCNIAVIFYKHNAKFFSQGYSSMIKWGAPTPKKPEGPTQQAQIPKTATPILETQSKTRTSKPP